MSVKNIEEVFRNYEILPKEEYENISKDRLDFGFDSIYFRYAEVCDELAMYKSIVNHSNPLEERKNMNWRKQHFYEALEQLVHAHYNSYQEGSK